MKRPQTTLRRKTYVLGTLYQHPLAKSIRRGLKVRGANMLSQNRVLEILKKSLSSRTTLTISGVIVPAAEKMTELRWLADLLSCPLHPELDLAYDLLETPIIAISGTDGKTSTTEMIAACLRKGGKKIELHVNFESTILETHKQSLDFVVAEVFSSQLESCETFRPRIAVLLNVAPDHFDQHGTWESYQQAKVNLFRQQGIGDTLVVNADCDVTMKLVEQFRSPDVRLFGYSKKPLSKIFSAGMYWHKGALWLKKAGIAKKVAFNVDVPTFFSEGEDFAANRLAALTAALAAGLSLRSSLSAILAYCKRRFRQELIATLGNGTEIINDSKSTSPHAASSALRRFGAKRPLIWVTGGTDKGLPLDEICKGLREQVEFIVVIGKFPRLCRELRGLKIPFRAFEDMKSGVRLALEKSAKHQVGGTLLFSPLGASEDLFRDYEDRGEEFLRLITREAGNAMKAKPSKRGHRKFSKLRPRKIQPKK